MKVQNVLPRDAIPSIDAPTFGREYFGDRDDEVIVVDADPPRAYPVRILSYHEIVNDVLDGNGPDPPDPDPAGDGGRPVAVTWCPICWSAAVYDRTVDGRTLTFGVSGKLADDALVMYDRETGSEWKQPLGEAIAGDLKGAQLTALPAAVTTYGRFADDHPDGVVLRPVRGTDGPGESPREVYDMDRYRRYVDSEEFGLHGMRGTGPRRTWGRDDIEAKTLVLGIERGGEAVGYPLDRVEAAGGVVTDAVGGHEVVVFAADGSLHAFENPGLAFEAAGDGTGDGSSVAFRADGMTWDPVTGESADGRQLERVPARRLFAFAWQDDHGPDAFY